MVISVACENTTNGRVSAAVYESPFVRLPVISLVAFIVAQLIVVLKSSCV